jgi:hypothetical protein
VPGNIEVVTVDEISGYPEHDGFPVRRDYAIKGTLPPLPDPIHRKVKLCRGQIKLASQVDIERNEFEEKVFITPIETMKLGNFPSWNEQIASWAASTGDSRFLLPTEYCDSADEISVSLDRPNDKSNIDGKEVEVRVKVVAAGEINRVEIFVNGSRYVSLAGRPFETTLNLSAGKYTIKAKAYPGRW